MKKVRTKFQKTLATPLFFERDYGVEPLIVTGM